MPSIEVETSRLLPGVRLFEPRHDSRGATGSPLQGWR
jgi:hypothetical protein